ncbi:hypothetical protein JCM3770_001143 [Rhodotorula araucariae]
MSTRPGKRARTRSPSPTLPVHLLTSLASSNALPPPSVDPALARLAFRFKHGVAAREATLLSPPLTRDGALPARWAGSTDETGEVWTDRYDILHLLPSLPPRAPTAPSSSSGRRGFSSLGSTHEEAFFFTPAERAALERTAARRRLEDERDARVRAAETRDEAERGERDAADAAEAEQQLALMRRLHATLAASPNPALLELRILANHAADTRFAFLRPGARGGRWRGVWERLRRGEKVGGEKGPMVQASSMAGIAAYGSSDEDEDEDEDEGEDGPAVEAPVVCADGNVEGRTAGDGAADPDAVVRVVPVSADDDGDALDAAERRKKEAKADKARQWARRRREAREADEQA